MGKMLGVYVKDNEQRVGYTLTDIAAAAGALSAGNINKRTAADH
jgi:hypothetical protein